MKIIVWTLLLCTGCASMRLSMMDPESIPQFQVLDESVKITLQPLYCCLIICIFICLPFLIAHIRYRRSSYYAVTKKPFLDVDKGTLGEYLIYKRTRVFEKDGGRFLFNLYLPKTKGKTTEVDVVLIHPKGLFVIESKNYNYWIFGNEIHRTWTQVLPRGRGNKSHKIQFYNPIRQNELHIKYLKRIVGETIPIWSIIVFSDRCVLKDVTISPKTQHKVIHLYELKSMISQIVERADVEHSSQQKVDRLYNQLYPYSQSCNQVKSNHIKSCF